MDQVKKDRKDGRPRIEKRTRVRGKRVSFAVNEFDKMMIDSKLRRAKKEAAIACPVVTLLFIFAIILYTDSPEYWGKRYYQVCNHPLQTNEKLLEHKQDAYELVIALFANGRVNKHRMKVHIREQEQRLKGKEIEHGKGE